MSPLRVSIALVLIAALAAPAFAQTLDDYLFDAFCSRPDMDKLISACYTPALADKSVYASDTTIPAYSAAHRGEFYGTSTNAGKKVFTVVAANPATQLISVSCSLGADSPTTDYIKLTSAKASENAESKVIKKLARVTPVKFTYGVLIEVDYSTSFRCTWQSVAA